MELAQITVLLQLLQKVFPSQIRHYKDVICVIHFVHHGFGASNLSVYIKKKKEKKEHETRQDRDLFEGVYHMKFMDRVS